MSVVLHDTHGWIRSCLEKKHSRPCTICAIPGIQPDQSFDLHLRALKTARIRRLEQGYLFTCPVNLDRHWRLLQSRKIYASENFKLYGTSKPKSMPTPFRAINTHVIRLQRRHRRVEEPGRILPVITLQCSISNIPDIHPRPVKDLNRRKPGSLK